MPAVSKNKSQVLNIDERRRALLEQQQQIAQELAALEQARQLELLPELEYRRVVAAARLDAILNEPVPQMERPTFAQLQAGPVLRYWLKAIRQQLGPAATVCPPEVLLQYCADVVYDAVALRRQADINRAHNQDLEEARAEVQRLALEIKQIKDANQPTTKPKGA